MIDNDNNSDGIFSGAGIEVFDDIQQKTEEEGLSFTINCVNCGTKNKVLISWEELIILALDKKFNKLLLPDSTWKLDAERKPNCCLKCVNCRRGNIILPMSFDAAEKHVEDAFLNGKISKDQVARIGEAIKNHPGTR